MHGLACLDQTEEQHCDDKSLTGIRYDQCCNGQDKSTVDKIYLPPSILLNRNKMLVCQNIFPIQTIENCKW